MINEQQANRYCKDDISKIKNYAQAIADTTQVWDIHHRTEIWWNCSAKELIENDCYYHRKACELIFLTKAEHRRLHHKGKTVAAETRDKLSESHKGENNPMYGRTFTTEHRLKMSESKKGDNNPMHGKHHSEESRKKISEGKKGQPGYWQGKTLSNEARQKMSEAKKAYWERRRKKES